MKPLRRRPVFFSKWLPQSIKHWLNISLQDAMEGFEVFRCHLFLWLGADPKILAKVGTDYPLVTRAARSGDVGILRLLLEFGGDACEGSEKGQFQPIHMAALKDKDKVIEVLVKFGANPNARYTMDFDGTVLAEGSGRTSMALAVTRGKTAAALTLYRLGASLYNIDEFGSDIHNIKGAVLETVATLNNEVELLES